MKSLKILSDAREIYYSLILVIFTRFRCNCSKDSTFDAITRNSKSISLDKVWKFREHLSSRKAHTHRVLYPRIYFVTSWLRVMMLLRHQISFILNVVNISNKMYASKSILFDAFYRGDLFIYGYRLPFSVSQLQLTGAQLWLLYPIFPRVPFEFFGPFNTGPPLATFTAVCVKIPGSSDSGLTTLVRMILLFFLTIKKQ